MLMFPSARRVDGEEQPFIPIPFAKSFKMRFPLIHWEIEVPELIQAAVVFVTGVSATAYLQDIFGLPFAVALSIVIVHECLYCLHQLFGDVLIGGWITPAVPLITTFLLTFEGNDRIYALISMGFLLSIIFFVLGITGLAGKLVKVTPNSIKAGILIGAGVSAVIGRYGFASAAANGVGFAKMPIAFSFGVLISLFLLFSKGFREMKEDGNKGIVSLLAKAGFVPALVVAYIIGVFAGELAIPSISLSEGIIFNPIPGLAWVNQNFSMLGIGFPPMEILIQTIPMAIVTYIIAFGDIIAGEQLLNEAAVIRTDEKIQIDTNKTNILTGIRNLIESLFSPTVTMSGPLWSAMTVTVVERYKGSKSMYSIIGGAGTFNLFKAIFCFVIPLVALVQPILPLSMSLTLMIQSFACFYIAFGMLKTSEERGVAGVVGGILAIAGPAVGLTAGVAVAVVCQVLGAKKVKPEVKINVEKDEILETEKE